MSIDHLNPRVWSHHGVASSDDVHRLSHGQAKGGCNCGQRYSSVLPSYSVEKTGSIYIFALCLLHMMCAKILIDKKGKRNVRSPCGSDEYPCQLLYAHGARKILFFFGGLFTISWTSGLIYPSRTITLTVPTVRELNKRTKYSSLCSPSCPFFNRRCLAKALSTATTISNFLFLRGYHFPTAIRHQGSLLSLTLPPPFLDPFHRLTRLDKARVRRILPTRLHHLNTDLLLPNSPFVCHSLREVLLRHSFREKNVIWSQAEKEKTQTHAARAK